MTLNEIFLTVTYCFPDWSAEVTFYHSEVNQFPSTLLSPNIDVNQFVCLQFYASIRAVNGMSYDTKRMIVSRVCTFTALM